MQISYRISHETVAYAAEELKTILRAVSGIESTICPDGFAADGIRLGFLSDFSRDASDVSDPLLDDVVDVVIENGSGFIAGSNPRSILFGVYDYAKSMGCRWVRPGEDGAYLPHCDVFAHSFTYRHKADYPFRGECIEGAVSFENVRDTIRWLPKVGMNLFMLEQIIPYNYMSRWYKHSVSTVKADEGKTFEEVGAYVPLLEQEVKRCGLQLHALGHGYLLEPYGIHYKTWADEYTLNDEARADIALVDGKRELYHGSPNFTQLCFSRPEVRAKLVKFLVEYAERKPYIDFLHVWLSDALGNQCECDECRKFHPSELYVKLLNELDEALTARHIPMRIVFIMYTDTRWAPLQERFRNSSRFVFTTAFARNYSQSYRIEHPVTQTPVWERNRTQIAPSFDTMMRFYDDWRQVFSGPAFAFEYYFYVDHYNDPGYYELGRVILEDIRALERFGLSGSMSDQTQRASFPNAFPRALFGEALFDKSLTLEGYAADFFPAAYGKDSVAVQEYLAGLSTLFDPASLRDSALSVTEIDTGTGKTDAKHTFWKNNPSAAARFAAVEPHVNAFRPIIERNRGLSDPCHAASWELLEIHAEYCVRLAAILYQGAMGSTDTALRLFDDMIDWLSREEDRIQPHFDLVLFHQAFSRKLK